MTGTVLSLRQILARVGVAVAALPLLLLVALAAFPWGVITSRAAASLSHIVGRPVSIAGAHRVDIFSLVPTVALTGVRIGEPDWAGNGAMAEIDEARIRFPALPLLFGHFRPHAVDLTGLRLKLLRDAHGRANWQSEKTSGRPGKAPNLSHLTIQHGTISLIDRTGQLAVRGTLAVGPAEGLRIAASGTHRGTPLTLAIQGASLDRAEPHAPWPLALHAASGLVRLDADARLDHPLDLAHFTAKVTANGRNIAYLDDLIEAGLFQSQPFALTATVRHSAPDWQIDRLDGRIGQSRLRADLTVQKRGGRTRLDGSVTARTLDFDDFASDTQRAQGAAKKRAEGKRILPDTRILLDHLLHLDGSVRLAAAQLIGAQPFRTLTTTVSLDHGRLALSPLAAGMGEGRVTGALSVTQRDGPIPTAALDLRLQGSTIQTLILPKGEVQGPLAARIVLHGPGATFREAMAHASGRVGLAVPSGSMRRDYATFLGGNVLKSIGAVIEGGDKGGRAPLHCLVGNFVATRGTLMPSPLLLDTTVSRGDARGTITLGDERVDLTFIGRPKQAGPLLSTTPTRLFGSLAAPTVDIRPPRAEQEHKNGLFDRLGAFVKGLRARSDLGRGAVAPDADCAGLERTALR